MAVMGGKAIEGLVDGGPEEMQVADEWEGYGPWWEAAVT